MVVQSEDDEVVDVAWNRQFFDANALNARSLLVNYFSNPPERTASHRTVWLTASDNSMRVVGISR
jgi:hypothetical protein